MAIKGNNILISMGGTVIAATHSNEIQSDAELIQISSPTTGTYKEFIAGIKGWSITVNFLILSNSTVQTLLNVGNTYTLAILGRGTPNTQLASGTAILKSCKITATKGNLCQGSFQFVGTGPLS